MEPTYHCVDSVKACLVHHGHLAEGDSGEAIVLLRLLRGGLFRVHPTSGSKDHEKKSEAMRKKGVDGGIVNRMKEVR